MSIENDKSQILRQIKLYYNFKTDRQFADFLGISPQGLASWFSRKTFDYDILYAKCEDLDGNWLLSGRGEMLRKKDNIVSKDINYYRALIEEKDKEIKILTKELGKCEGKIEILEERLKDYKSASTKNVPLESTSKRDTNAPRVR